MKDVDLSYVFDLERIIKKANKIYLSNKKNEEKLEAHYILKSFTENKEVSSLNITEKDLKNATIKTSEILKTTSKKNHNPKNKRKRVVKDFIMTDKEKLKIIRQTTLLTKINRAKNFSRNIEILEDTDMINEGYLTTEGYLDYKNPIVKKLIPRK